ncbi:methylosome subunit pICln [Cimex lectularius]|uniref:Methylosome subunit pICln n=1 Tax=Cimex lectularius TaxID=79782 RepID=A0A8I6S3U5_CIMLE|nr:methylosome subunit pICln [Cimex lectularius]
MVVVTNCTPPTEGVRHEQPATVAVMNKKDLGKGTIYIAESCLSWVNEATGRGFSLQYPHICVHAVSRDTSTYPKECLYLMIDANIDFSGEEQGSDEEEEDAEDKMTEIRFIPDDKTSLDSMYSAMNVCQALHPDPQQDSLSEEEAGGPVGPGGDNNEDDDDDDEAFMDADDECLNRANGARNLEMEVEGQFDNADEVDAGYEEN